MKLLFLALCFCLAAAENSQIMDELEKLLSADDQPPPPEIDILNKMDELDALSEDARQPEPVVSEKEYGYCLDGQTKAAGPNMKGCSRKLCYDGKPGQCNKELRRLNKEERKKACYKHYMIYRENCPYTCGFCKPPSPSLECSRKYGAGAKYGCCWDGLPALTPDKRDCLRCMDFFPHTCRQFYNNMNGEKCGTNSYRIRNFLQRRCPRLCGRCS